MVASRHVIGDTRSIQEHVARGKLALEILNARPELKQKIVGNHAGAGKTRNWESSYEIIQRAKRILPEEDPVFYGYFLAKMGYPPPDLGSSPKSNEHSSQVLIDDFKYLPQKGLAAEEIKPESITIHKPGETISFEAGRIPLEHQGWRPSPLTGNLVDPRTFNFLMFSKSAMADLWIRANRFSRMEAYIVHHGMTVDEAYKRVYEETRIPYALPEGKPKLKKKHKKLPASQLIIEMKPAELSDLKCAIQLNQGDKELLERFRTSCTLTLTQPYEPRIHKLISAGYVTTEDNGTLHRTKKLEDWLSS